MPVPGLAWHADNDHDIGLGGSVAGQQKFTKADILRLRFYPGAREGLADRTAVVNLSFDFDLDDFAGVAERVRRQAIRFRPQDPLPGMQPADWPGAFLHAGSLESSLGEWLVALTVAFQRWARDPVGPGRVLAASGNSIDLALPWERKEVCKAALEMAVRHLLRWLQPGPDPESSRRLAENFEKWLADAQPGGLPPNSLRFAHSARQRGMPLAIESGLLAIGWGCNKWRLDSSFTDGTGYLAVRIARQKFRTSQLLRQARLPVPASALVHRLEGALHLARQMGWPLVVKPSDLDQGVGVVPGIRNEARLRKAFAQASQLSPSGVIIEKHVEGEDHRMLVVDGKLWMTTKRIPGGVTGNGRSTVEQLLAEINANPLRGTGKRSMLIILNLDEEALDCLAEAGLTPQSVPAAGRFVALRRTANISTGGTAVDVTDRVHPDNRIVAERAARLIGLDLAGVDFLCPNISRSWREVGGAICEVNGQPGLRVHWLGAPERDINGEILDWHFRDRPARIPTAAITGTNGKSTVARMLHRIWMQHGKRAGVVTTNGVWVGDDLVSTDNLSGCPGGRLLLEDPAVQAAVIEMPRKGLIVFGHPCDRYDVAALLNVQDDHVGVDGIDSLEAMARLKAEVLERAVEAAVVNAEDPLCLAMRERSAARRLILVATRLDVPALAEHLAQNGAGVFLAPHEDENWIVLAEGKQRTPLMPVHDIPATLGGLLRFNESNALFAAALAWAQGIPQDTIRAALAGFANSPAHNPGRYNFIDGYPFQVLLDYGHNPDGVQALCAVVGKLEIPGRRHLLNLKLGNRHKAHWAASAPVLAQTFDSFVLGCDAKYVKACQDYAGADPEGAMLATGHDALMAQGVAADRIALERDQRQAIRLALTQAQPGDLLVLLAEPWVALPILEAGRA